MARLALIAAVLVFAAPAFAQDKPAAKDAAKPAAKPAAAVAAAGDGRKSRRNEDARHCLGKASNTEIIKCAEAFL